MVPTPEERPAPYPADTKAKGWRFELDYERIEQSDTWVLAPPEMRPWLLMIWMTAWRQVPCGSLPATDELIAARIGMDLRQFKAHRDILLRGWWLAADGRLYHSVITEQVTGLMELRAKEAARKQEWRDKKNQGLAHAGHAVVPRDNTGTPASATAPEPEPEPEPSKAAKTKTASPGAPRRRQSQVADAIQMMVADGVSADVAASWMQVRKEKRLPLTELAWREVKEQASRVGMTPHQAVEYAARRPWGGFKAKWVEQDRVTGYGTKPATSKSIAGMNYGEGIGEDGRIL